MNEQLSREEGKKKCQMLNNLSLCLILMGGIVGIPAWTDNLLLSILHSGAGFVLIGIGYFLFKKSKNLRKIYGIKLLPKTENLKDSKFLQKKRKTRKELLNTLVLAAQKHNIKVTPEVYRKLVKPHLKMSFSNIALYGLGITFLVVGIIPILAVHLNVITLSENFQHIYLLNAGLGVITIAEATYKRLMIKRFYKKMINEIKEQQKSLVK